MPGNLQEGGNMAAIKQAFPKPGKKKKKKKSELQKKKDNPNSKYWKTKADGAWGKLMHQMYNRCYVDNGECSGPLEAHHLITRSNTVTRHNPANGLVGCSWHHKFSPTLSPHKGPIGFAKFLEKNHPGKYEFVIANQFKPGKPNYMAAHEMLLPLIKK